MSHMLSISRNFIDSPAGLPARIAMSLMQASGQAALVERWSRDLSIPTLKVDWLREVSKQRKTLFILGSGESVEDLSAAEWSIVRQNFSIGINAWPLHPFVPDVLAFEPFNEASTDYLQLFEKVLTEERFSRKKPKILLFRPKSDLDGARYLLLPDYLKVNARIYGRYVPNSRNLDTLEKEISALEGLQNRGRIAESLLLDSGATVIRLVSLGLRLGFKKIVLLGIDLNGGQYFWEKNPERLIARGLKNFSPGFTRSIHQTMSREDKPFIVTEVLNVLNAIMLRRDGSLYAGSSKSLLAGFFPIHQWQSPQSSTSSV